MAVDNLAGAGMREIIERNIARVRSGTFRTNDVRARYRAVPCRRIVGIGNLIRHDYDEIDDRGMWDMESRSSCPATRLWKGCSTEVGASDARG
jgi:Protein of unknown function DUF86